MVFFTVLSNLSVWTFNRRRMPRITDLVDDDNVTIEEDMPVRLAFYVLGCATFWREGLVRVCTWSSSCRRIVVYVPFYGTSLKWLAAHKLFIFYYYYFYRTIRKWTVLLSDLMIERQRR